MNPSSPNIRDRSETGSVPQRLDDGKELHARFVVPPTEYGHNVRLEAGAKRFAERRSWRRRMAAFNFFFLLVPPLAAAGYLFGYATSAYEVDTVLAIRNPANAVSGSSSMVNSLTSGVANGGSTSLERAIDESYAVANFVQSRQAFDELNKRMDLSPRFQKTTIDWLGRLRPDATHEQQYQYYLKHISVSYDDVEGEVNLSTYGYDAQTTYQMAQELGRMSEQMVNEFNERSQTDLITLARQQVSEAAAEMKSANEAITKFQLEHAMIDPSSETTSFGTIINTLREQASTKRAEMNALEKTSVPNSPRSVEIRNMLQATERQIADEQSKLTGQAGALAPLIGTFKLLSVDSQLAQQKYSSAVAMLQSSLIQNEHQKLYVVDVVSAQTPVQPTLPNRWSILFGVIGGTLVAWLIARLVMAAVRDHRV